MPPSLGASWVSSDMNCGANVPTGVLFRAEFDRTRDKSFWPCGLLSCVRDWFRRWPIFGSVSAKGEDAMRADTGRAAVGAGDGEGEFLAKGELRELRH